MPVIQPENIGDFVTDTLNDLGKPNFTDISSSIQDHYALKNLFRENRVILQSGKGIQFNVLAGQSNAARNVSIGQSDKVNAVDGMIQASTVWRGSETSYMIFGETVSMNSGASEIVDYVKQQRQMAMISYAELMETNLWSAPAATDNLTPLGLPYWITKNATTGFTGGVLSGYSTVAGLSPTTYPNWQNYAGLYVNPTRDDLIRSIRLACQLTKFKSAVEGIPSPNTGDDYGFYTNINVQQPLAEALEAQNENLGNDLAPMDNKATLRMRPIHWVPWLDRDTTNPFMGINWGWLKTYILRDWWMKETNIPYTPGQHTVASHWIDCRYQIVSKNRRCHFVLATGTGYPS